MEDTEQFSYRMKGVGLTRLVLGPGTLRAGQPRNGYRERDIPLEMIEGFCVEPMSRPNALAGFNGDLVLAFRHDDKRRVYRLAVDVDDPELQRVVAALGERCSQADLSGLPVSEALARLRVPSSGKQTLWMVAIVLGGIAIIVLVMVVLWLRDH